MKVNRKCSSVGCKRLAESRGYCGAHYIQAYRLGAFEPAVRAPDWGSRAQHPLYGFWKTMRRFRRKVICKEWVDDFWSFANEVKTRPDDGARHELYAVDEAKEIGPGNWFWRRCNDRIDSIGQRDYMRQWQRRKRAIDPMHQKRQDLKKYGVTVEWYQATLDAQGNVCRICKQEEPVECKGKRLALAVDHDHETGKVRGLLCSQCNRAIGLFRHDSKRLVSAIEYLDAFPSG